MIYPATDQYINLANDTLENGEVIVYPTDTLYGFGVDATNTEAIHKLNRLKGRIQPLSIILESVEHLHDFAEFDVDIESQMKELFPGRYTALLPAKESNLSPFVQNGSPKIGFAFQTTFSRLNWLNYSESPL